MPASRVILSSGCVVVGEPHDTAEYRMTARQLGYGEDVGAMCRDHDPLHQALANWLGIADSYALREAAGLLRPEDNHIALAEEFAVLAIQRYMTIAGGRLPMRALMPLSRLEIEQTAQDRWVAEVEVGGISNYRITVRGNDFAQIIAECERAYYGRRPDERPYNPLPSDLVTLEEERKTRLEVLGETFSPEVARAVSADTGGYMPKPQRVLSEEHKRAMAEGRARARVMKDFNDRVTKSGDEGPDAA